jgi:hypothetical protein
MWLPRQFLSLCAGTAVLLAVSARADPLKQRLETHLVPYRLTDTRHVLVRVKINGKGPFNFIMDTGSPALFVSKAVGRKLGIEADAKNGATLDRLELEGGAALDKVKARVDDPYQLEGMNKLNLAGCELHGVIGYPVLARFRIGLDVTKDRMTWTRLDFDPPAAEAIGSKANVDALAGLVKVMTTLVGERGPAEVRLRGFVGVELAQKDGMVVVAAVVPDSPAAGAGLRPGDRLTHVRGQPVATAAEAVRLTAPVAAGEVLELTTVRGEQARDVRLKLAQGL